MSDPASANSQELETLKKARHVGSPTSILFLTKGVNGNDNADADDHDDCLSLYHHHHLQFSST